jgi:hypothetical protein
MTWLSVFVLAFAALWVTSAEKAEAGVYVDVRVGRRPVVVRPIVVRPVIVEPRPTVVTTTTYTTGCTTSYATPVTTVARPTVVYTTPIVAYPAVVVRHRPPVYRVLRSIIRSFSRPHRGRHHHYQPSCKRADYRPRHRSHRGGRHRRH